MSLRLVPPLCPPLAAGTPGDPGPAPLRAQYGLRWSAAQRGLWWLFTHAVHVVMGRLAPARLRFWDHYHVAVVRCRPAAVPGAGLAGAAPPGAALPGRDDLAR
jgi:hypothetical protein